MEYLLLERHGGGEYGSTFYSNDDIATLSLFFGTDVGDSPSTWGGWIMDDSEGTECSGNITALEKEGDYVYMSFLYDEGDNITKLKISRHSLHELIIKWFQTISIKPKYIVITHVIEDDTFAIHTSNDECAPLELLKKMNLNKRFISFSLRPSGKYDNNASSDSALGHVAHFLTDEVTCSSDYWKNWIFDDSQGLEKRGEIVSLIKKDNLICFEGFYDTFIIPRHQLAQLLDEWNEKIWKSKPRHATILYNNDIFTIETH
jgi:hypothetical protein